METETVHPAALPWTVEEFERQIQVWLDSTVPTELEEMAEEDSAEQMAKHMAVQLAQHLYGNLAQAMIGAENAKYFGYRAGKSVTTERLLFPAAPMSLLSTCCDAPPLGEFHEQVVTDGKAETAHYQTGRCSKCRDNAVFIRGDSMMEKMSYEEVVKHYSKGIRRSRGDNAVVLALLPGECLVFDPCPAEHIQYRDNGWSCSRAASLSTTARNHNQKVRVWHSDGALIVYREPVKETA